jgi:hypothetical protein
VALSWAPVGSEAKRLSLAKDKQAWTFTIGDKKLVFDWEDGQAIFRP